MFTLMFLIVVINSDNLRGHRMKAMKDFARAVLTSTTQNSNERIIFEGLVTVHKFYKFTSFTQTGSPSFFLFR